jgi:predicted PurR-regulated permease PerM
METGSVGEESGERAVVVMERKEMWHRYGKYPYLLAKFVFYGSILVLCYLILNTIGAVLFPLFVSVLIAYLLDPTVDSLEERGLGRSVATGLVMGAVVLGIAIFVAFLYPLLATQVIQIIEKFPGLVDSLQHEFLPWLQRTFKVEVPPTLSEAVARYSGEIKSAAPAVLRKAGDWVTGILSGSGVVVSSLLNLVMIPIFIFYFLRDFDSSKDEARRFIPLWCRAAVLERLGRIDEVMGAWFRGQIQVALILAAMYALGLGVCFGVSGLSIFDGVALGVISGILNAVPYLGFVIGFGLSVLIVLINWSGFGPLIGVIVVFAVVQGLEGYVITPKIVGEKVGLSPVVVIIVLLIGGEVGGLLGIVLAIPAAGAIKVILPDLVAAYRSSPYFHGRVDVWQDPMETALANVTARHLAIQAPAAQVTVAVTPEAIDALDGPETAEAPETPETPEVPEVAEVAEVPEVAEAPEAEEPR